MGPERNHRIIGPTARASSAQGIALGSEGTLEDDAA
jgi:hypothetical protein